MPLHTIKPSPGAPLKTRYAILDPVPETEPGVIPCNPRDLETLTWVDCEFKGSSPTLEELHWLLDPLFPDAEGFERVAVNSFKGPTDMFVAEDGVRNGLPINGAATLVYWTATMMRELASGSMAGLGEYYTAHRAAALVRAADLFTVAPHHTPPRIHGRAVLFDDQVWR